MPTAHLLDGERLRAIHALLERRGMTLGPWSGNGCPNGGSPCRRCRHGRNRDRRRWRACGPASAVDPCSRRHGTIPHCGELPLGLMECRQLRGLGPDRPASLGPAGRRRHGDSRGFHLPQPRVSPRLWSPGGFRGSRGQMVAASRGPARMRAVFVADRTHISKPGRHFLCEELAQIVAMVRNADALEIAFHDCTKARNSIAGTTQSGQGHR